MPTWSRLRNSNCASRSSLSRSGKKLPNPTPVCFCNSKLVLKQRERSQLRLDTSFWSMMPTYRRNFRQIQSLGNLRSIVSWGILWTPQSPLKLIQSSSRPNFTSKTMSFHLQMAMKYRSICVQGKQSFPSDLWKHNRCTILNFYRTFQSALRFRSTWWWDLWKICPNWLYREDTFAWMFCQCAGSCSERLFDQNKESDISKRMAGHWRWGFFPRRSGIFWLEKMNWIKPREGEWK